MPVTLSSRYQASEGLSRYAEREAEEILRIYTTRFPDKRVRLILYEGDNPVWAAPSIVPGEPALGPEHCGPGFLGIVEGGVEDGEAVTVFSSIPRRPTPAEREDTEAPWVPSTRMLGTLFRVSPLLYEDLRHRHELRRQKEMETHQWSPLPNSTGGARFVPAEPDFGDRRPAVLVGFHWLEVGGAEKLGFDCVRWAQEAGLRVFVVASVQALQRLADRLPDSDDVTFIRLDRYLAHGEWAPYVLNLIRQENIRLIHIHHCVPLYSALPTVRMMAPWVQVVDSTHIIEYSDGGYPRISGVWSNFIDVHHVISRELIAMYRDRFHVSNKVRLGRMLDRPEAPRQLPAPNMAAGKQVLTITFVGRLYYQKRPGLVVLIMKALADWAGKAGVTLQFHFVGEGPFEKACTGLMRRLGLEAMTKLHAAGTDIPALLGQSDILLLPSSNEGLALVCYEAIEKGAIPLSTDVGSQSEIVPPELLLPRAPRAALKRTVEIVDRMWRDGDFVAAQGRELATRYAAVAADPTAREVMMPLYEAVAGTK
ncbi:glycosyltransferase [Acidimangrovimonas pyrenivorans]|uniref:Glycosyltransferase n=1 Tax=Acidimangrovimonas pyrenivorans TaxID=2030798 RepID=A0ABV7ANY0_9RHOB